MKEGKELQLSPAPGISGIFYKPSLIFLFISPNDILYLYIIYNVIISIPSTNIKE